MLLSVLSLFVLARYYFFLFFFFNDTATTEIYTLSLHDALPICVDRRSGAERGVAEGRPCDAAAAAREPRQDGSSIARDRKSTRLNSSHLGISYAVFCLKKKKETRDTRQSTSAPEPGSRRVWPDI